MLEVTLFLLLLLVLLGAKVYRNTFGYWRGRGIRYLSIPEYVQLVYDNFTKPLDEVAKRSYKKYGRLYGSYQGYVPTLVVGDPDLLRDIYVKDFKSFVDRTVPRVSGNPIWDKGLLNIDGEAWKASRNVISPAFTSSKLRAMIPTVKKIAFQLCRRLLEEGVKKEGVGVAKLYADHMRDMMAALVFTLDLKSEQNPDHPLVKAYNELFDEATSGWKMILLFTMPRIFKRLPLEFPDRRGTTFVTELTQHMIKERLSQQNKEFDDVLQLCLKAETGGKNVGEAEISDTLIEEVAAQCLQFFLGGGGTMASALNFITYALALHPEHQEEAVREIQNALTEDEITYDSLKSMTFLECVIQESLRLYDLDAWIFRVCTQDTTVSGIPLKAGMAIEIPSPGIHSDPEFFPEPEVFKPQRFLPENKDSLKPYTVHTFGHGPRGCIGTRMAIVQMKAILATILREVRFEVCSETQIPLKYASGIMILEPETPIKVKVVPRRSSQP